MIAVIDNYDSFTYNLVQYLGEMGAAVKVFRNDRITPGALLADGTLRGVVISPGPGRPEQAGVCLEVIRSLAGRLPILGVCLGHQCIGAAYGARIVRATRLLHGKTSPVFHHGGGLYAGVESPFPAGRYHSLLVAREDLPPCLEVTAETAEGEIMGLRHTKHLVEGVQFHPESVLTGVGRVILANFLKLTGEGGRK
ncbi:MAG TPA: aminodeoxychorismate/anthranilate synthase component II [Firmicutes bacterium]|nr:aminodeoxychorismate/anthranilate synthase component II [Bacillota bacterium]